MSNLAETAKPINYTTCAIMVAKAGIESKDRHGCGWSTQHLRDYPIGLAASYLDRPRPQANDARLKEKIQCSSAETKHSF